MKRKNSFFMLGVITVICLAFIALIYLTAVQEEKLSEEFPTGEEYRDLVVEGVTDDFDYANQPSIGSEDAPVKIVEFGDYKCSHCFDWTRDVYPKIYEDYIKTGKVEFYFLNKQFIAVDSILAGAAAEAVYEQNEESFWEFHEGLYKTSQMTLASNWGTQDRLMKVAIENITSEDFDFEKLREDISSFKYINEVKRDDEIANNKGVTGTPTVFVNGVRVASDYESLKEAVEAAIELEEADE